MKILHTADWHLGHKLFNADREAEHQHVLDWLVDYIKEESIELLIIAGDVFDTDSPPNFARKQYYSFLCKLVDTCCRNVVVVAGNHDSANMLDASGEVLRLLNVHVIGNLPENRKEQIIEIKDVKGKLQAVVGAVPYLRDRDIRQGVAGQSFDERLRALRLGIENHYQEIADELEKYRKKNIPILVTGHFYVSGGERDGRPNSIHIGSLDVVDASCFSTLFDYVALGHLHRPQVVDKKQHIRYSGSLIPMDFNEWNYKQAVTLLEFEKKKLNKIQQIPVPLLRKLIYYQGEIDYIREKLSGLKTKEGLSNWLKIELITETYHPHLEEELMSLLADKNIEIILLNQIAPSNANLLKQKQQQLQSLSDLDPVEVFQMKLDTAKINETEAREELEHTFTELMNWMQERDNV